MQGSLLSCITLLRSCNKLATRVWSCASLSFSNKHLLHITAFTSTTRKRSHCILSTARPGYGIQHTLSGVRCGVVESKCAERHCVSEKISRTTLRVGEESSRSGAAERGASDSRPEAADQGCRTRCCSQPRRGSRTMGSQTRSSYQPPRSSRPKGSPTEIKLLTTSKLYSAEREIVLFSRIKVGAFGNNYGPVYISYRGTEVSVSI